MLMVVVCVMLDGDDDEVGDGDEGRGIVQVEVRGRAVRCVAAVKEDENGDLWADCAICVVNEKIVIRVVDRAG